MTCTEDKCLAGICVHTINDTLCDDNKRYFKVTPFGIILIKISCTVDLCDLSLGICTNIPDNSLCNDESKFFFHI